MPPIRHDRQAPRKEEPLLVRKTGMGLRRCVIGSVEELEELDRGQARLPQDRDDANVPRFTTPRRGRLPRAPRGSVIPHDCPCPHIAETD
jgi:hypothetical protein